MNYQSNKNTVDEWLSMVNKLTAMERLAVRDERDWERFDKLPPYEKESYRFNELRNYIKKNNK